MSKCLIIGFGSIGERHAEVLNRLGFEINVISKRKNLNFLTRKKIESFNLNEFEYVVISNSTENHLNTLLAVDKYFKTKAILVEKPLSSFPSNYLPKNKVFIGYNMRFNPIIVELNKIIKSKKNLFIESRCTSYFPSWRKGNYSKSYSAKFNGGGVLRELSHELDYIKWIFGKFKFDYNISSKLSNLNISTDDFFFGLGRIQGLSKIYFHLDYASHLEQRILNIKSNNINLTFDFISKTITGQVKSRTFNKKLTFDRNHSYKNMWLDIISNKGRNCCSYKDGMDTVKLIDQLRKNKYE